MRTTVKSSLFVLILVSLLLLPTLHFTAQATIILGTNNWKKSHLADWTKTDDWTKPSEKGSYLNAYLESPAPLADKDYAQNYTSASNLFAGNLSSTPYAEPNFWSTNAVRKSRRIMRGSINENTSIETPTELRSAFFSDYTDWEYDVDQAAFVSDLESIDWINSYIWDTKLDDQTYGIDNSLLVVPEPHTVILLLASGATAALAFWKKRTANTTCS